ncbi:hypothetical protein KIN20_001727 [Parelaphostrongylus tenuis]|uniref:Uncharacterized protein n=1 Tax=Parelaphostrongylus tenuis TaxID=148309 RepID=A0AAD5QEU9_PARTN|nr:hypothetical protein KIN20_001727 [Parelaphostrongylus tenuis]
MNELDKCSVQATVIIGFASKNDSYGTVVDVDHYNVRLYTPMLYAIKAVDLLLVRLQRGRRNSEL